MTRMERDIRLATASREDLLQVIASQRRMLAQLTATVARLEAQTAQQQATIAEQQAVIAELEQRLADLESRLGPGPGSGTPHGFPGHKPQQAPPPPAQPLPRERRQQQFTRKRSAQPDEVVVHAVEQCPDCQARLQGGWLKRRREVIEVVLAPAKVVEHQYWTRQCPSCGKRLTPKADLGQQVAGQMRLGVNLVSLIATLREQGRLPLPTIQWALQTFWGLRLSQGALVEALHRVAQRGHDEVERIQKQIQQSRVVHGDETGWRQNGRNGYIWSFSTAAARFYLWGRRTKDMVDRALGPDFAGVLCTDFYASYDHYAGEHQRCWVHLLRDIHDLQRQYPQDLALQRWARQVHRLYTKAKAGVGVTPEHRFAARERYERALLKLCQPFLGQTAAPQRVLCERIQKYLKELFVFVSHTEAPSDNNAAERSVRHMVTTRKISGGSRGEGGTSTRMTLATLFGTWRLRNLDPFAACRQLLISPQP